MVKSCDNCGWNKSEDSVAECGLPGLKCNWKSISDKKVLKADEGKLRWDLLPMDVIEKIVDIYTFGLRDHEEESWKKVDQKRYYAALMRHLVEWKKGVPIDPDSKRSHLAHMAWNAIAMLWHEIQKEQPEMKMDWKDELDLSKFTGERKTCITCGNYSSTGCFLGIAKGDCLSNDYFLWRSKFITEEKMCENCIEYRNYDKPKYIAKCNFETDCMKDNFSHFEKMKDESNK